MTGVGIRQPSACGSVLLKARERKRRLHVSISMPFSCVICSGGRGGVVLVALWASKVIL